MDERVLFRFNEWWLTGRVREELTGKFRREDYESWKKSLNEREIVLFYGLRRVGKTTTMYQLIDDLLKSGADPEKILYFSFDESSADIEEVIRTYTEIALKKPLSEAGRVYIFLDEIQKAGSWENKVKIYYDLYPDIKFVISGSSSINLAMGSSETLAGRIIRVKIEPLSFGEFCRLKNLDVPYEKIEYAQDFLGPLFMEYLEKGGFPELVEATDHLKIRNYIRSIVIDRIVAMDLPQEFGVRDMDLLRRLMELLLQNPGMIINLDKLASSFRRNRITISNFISYMEYAFVIRTVANYRPGKEASSRKMKKVYPYLPAFYISMLAPVEIPDAGKIMENAVATILSAEYYYREGNNEIDFVLRHGSTIIPIEVKSGDSDLSEFLKALRRINSRSGIVIGRGKITMEKRGDLIVLRCPVHALAMYPDRVLNDFISNVGDASANKQGS